MSFQMPTETISIGQMHAGQAVAFRALQGHRLKALRCGRRYGNTDFGKIWIADALARGQECAWFAPQHNTWSEVFQAMVELFRPILKEASKSRSPRLSRGTRRQSISFATATGPMVMPSRTGLQRWASVITRRRHGHPGRTAMRSG